MLLLPNWELFGERGFRPFELLNLKSKDVDLTSGGFGVGIKRLIGAITGTTDLRQIQPYPRTPEVTISF